MATKTTNDVVTLALQIMNVIGAGETPDADTYVIASSAYTALHADMRAEYADLFKAARMSWNADAVPEDYFAHVAGLLAGMLVNLVPCSDTGRGRAQAAAETADIAIRNRLQRYSPEISRFDDALSPHHSLYGVWRRP